ncbi:DUF7660 family protein [Sphingobacterium kyonggiense]
METIDNKKTMDILKQANTIKDKEDFVEFMKQLSRDIAENPQVWDNDSLEHYIGGLWGYSISLETDVPTWKLFAQMLLAARVYE